MFQEGKSKEQLEAELHEKQELLDRMQKDADNKEEEIKFAICQLPLNN